MTQEIEFRIDLPGEVLVDYYQDQSRVSLIMGPLGSGKTITTCMKIFRLMCDQEPNAEGIRPSRWFAIRNTYPDLETTTIKDWLAVVGDLGKFTQSYPPRHVISFLLEDGTRVESEMIFLALDRPDSIKKLRGTQATGFWLNEVKELSKAVIDMADLRHGRYPSMADGGVEPTWHGMTGDTNAPDEDHWYYNLSEEARPHNWLFHRQPGGLFIDGEGFRPNPDAENLDNLPDGYYTNGMAGKSKDWIKVNLCNEYGFVSDGKPIYPEYVDSVHCLPDDYIPDPKLPIRLGFDFGMTPAAAFIQFIPGIGRYVGFDEFVTDGFSATEFAPELKRYIDMHYPDFTFEMGKGDPSGDSGNQTTKDTPFKILKAAGINAQPTDTNDPSVRRASIVRPMKRLCMDGKPGFMISPKCKIWRKGLQGGFRYKRVIAPGEPRYHDKPDKNQYSHICEAGEYGLQGAGEGRKAVIGTPRIQKPFNAGGSWTPFDR
ncbi:MAG: TerL [Anderseniella sp.]|nr:TerL [Anderseniella sp.]